MSFPFFTIGHSTRSISEFVNLLRNAGVQLVADVRTVPRSHTNPQYNRDVLSNALSEFQIEYEHFAALGGLRGRKRDVPQTVNAFWLSFGPEVELRRHALTSAGSLSWMSTPDEMTLSSSDIPLAITPSKQPVLASIHGTSPGACRP